MKSFEDQARTMLRDLDPDFVEKIAVGLAWTYSELYEELAADETLDGYGREERFHRRMAECGRRALASAAQQHGVPYEHRRLSCNGQTKLLVKAGRVILIHEPIFSIDNHPAVADYKLELADLHGFVRQLELDLGDQPNRIRDWSGCLLGVVLHGAAGPGFDRRQKSLGRTMLAVPDADYTHWVMRVDLQKVAMFGRAVQRDEPNMRPTQEDQVIVTPKRRNCSAEAETD